MTRLVRLLITVAFASSLLFVGCVSHPGPAAGDTFADHYVSPSGTATWAQSISATTPCSISTAISSVSPGDVVHLAAGTYGSRYTFGRSGTSQARIRWLGGPGVVLSRGLIVSGSYNDLSDIEVTPGSSTISDEWRVGQVEVSGNYNTLKGFYIHDIARASAFCFTDFSKAAHNLFTDFTIDTVRQKGIMFGRGVDYNTVSHGTITNFGGMAGIDMGTYPVGTHPDHCTIEYVDIKGPNGWADDSDGDAMRLNAPNTTVRYCTMDIWQLLDEDPSHDFSNKGPHSDVVMWWSDFENLLIENCVIGSWNTEYSWDGKHSAAAGIMCGNFESTPYNVTIRNCVILCADAGKPPAPYTNPSDNPVISIGTQRQHWYNNIFWGRYSSFAGGGTFRNNIFLTASSSMSGQDSDYNVFVGTGPSRGRGAHDIVVPNVAALGFVDYDMSAATDYGMKSDWRPSLGSPLIDAGDPAYAPPTDMTGGARDDAPDIGPHEYRGPRSRPVSSLAAVPTNSVRLTWANPTSSTFAGVRILRSTAGFATSPTATSSQQIVYEGSATAFTDHPTVSAVTYYTVFARDAVHGWSAPKGVKQDPATRVASQSSITAGYAKPGVIQVRLLDTNGRGINGQQMVVRRSDGVLASMTPVAVAGTPSGTYLATVGLIGGKRTSFTVRYAGDAFFKPSTAAVAVVPRAHLHKPKAPSAVRGKRAFTLSAQLMPTHKVRTRAVRFRLYRREKGEWVYRKTVTGVVKSNSRNISKITARTSLRYTGKWRVRAYHSDAGHAPTYSSYTYFRVN